MRKNVITKNDKIADLITKYPSLKEKLIIRNKIFQRLNNPVVFNSVGKFARIQEIAKVSGKDLDELLRLSIRP